MFNPKLYASKPLAISIFMIFFQEITALSLEFASLWIKNDCHLLLFLNIRKPSNLLVMDAST